MNSVGNLNPDGFYKYLTVWKNLDNMMYYVSQASLFPAPPNWDHDAKDLEQSSELIPLEIPCHGEG